MSPREIAAGPRRACFTIDLEPDFLSDDSHEVLLDAGRMEQLRGFFARHRIPPTVFVVARMLEQGLPVRERFAGVGAEFELHSYSHRVDAPDSEEEIASGAAAFERYFGRRPRGYRAPLGRITAAGIATLARLGFEYDASVFPSRRPELGYDFSALPTTPWRWQEQPGIVEIPFAAASPLRFVVSLSFLKLMGLRFFDLLFRASRPPDLLVLDSHLYDFFSTSPVHSLSVLDWRRYALLRNMRRVFPLLDGFVRLLGRHGYEFATVGEVHDALVARDAPLPTVPLSVLASGYRTSWAGAEPAPPARPSLRAASSTPSTSLE